MSEQPRCGTCRFWAGAPNPNAWMALACKRHAPVALTIEPAGGRAMPRWPEVKSENWCGDYAEYVVLVKAEEGR